MKTCWTCRHEKPLSEFSKSSRDGHQDQCKACRSKYGCARDKTYRLKNAEAINAKRRAQYLKNKETISAARRKAYAADPDTARQRAAQRRKEKPSECAAAIAAWQQANASRANAINKRRELYT